MTDVEYIEIGCDGMKKGTSKLVTVGVDVDVQKKIRLLAALEGIKIKDFLRKTFENIKIKQAGNY